MFQKILCPVDFSSGSKQAMRVAVRMARTAGAELTLAHAWHIPALAFAGEYPMPAGAIDGMVADEQRELAAAVAEATALGAPRVTSRFVDGLPWESLCDLLRADPTYDLAVMGTHGRTGFRRILLGSVAEQVIRHAPCSVLTVRGRDAGPPFRHILCPIDLSASSRQAMNLAAELVAPDGQGIVLLHVLQLPPASVVDPATPPYAVEVERAARRHVEEWAAELRARVSVPVVTRIESGGPAARALTALDADMSFDLVVVGSHGRTGLTRVLIGSVAEQITRHAPCPVLVARSRGGAAGANASLVMA